jgi:hypothetical protein
LIIHYQLSSVITHPVYNFGDELQLASTPVFIRNQAFGTSGRRVRLLGLSALSFLSGRYDAAFAFLELLRYRRSKLGSLNDSGQIGTVEIPPGGELRECSFPELL